MLLNCHRERMPCSRRAQESGLRRLATVFVDWREAPLIGIARHGCRPRIWCPARFVSCIPVDVLVAVHHCLTVSSVNSTINLSTFTVKISHPLGRPVLSVDEWLTTQWAAGMQTECANFLQVGRHLRGSRGFDCVFPSPRPYIPV